MGFRYYMKGERCLSRSLGAVYLRYPSLGEASDAEGDIETSGGGIEVEVDQDASLDLDARTSGGRVKVEGDILIRGGTSSRSEVQGEINGGGPLLSLRTSGGNVRLRMR